MPVSARPSTHEQQREISTSLPHTGGDLCTVMTHGKDMLQCPALFAVFMCAAMGPLFVLGLERDASLTAISVPIDDYIASLNRIFTHGSFTLGVGL